MGILLGCAINSIAFYSMQELIPAPWQCGQCAMGRPWYTTSSWIALLVHADATSSCSHPPLWYNLVIELIAAILFPLTWYVLSVQFCAAYTLFFCILLINMRTDWQTMFLSRYATLYLVPLGLLLSGLRLLPMHPLESFIGALFGYTVLYTIATLFFHILKKQGMGEGDYDLLALIGAFTGMSGAWSTLFIASLLGSLYGLAAHCRTHSPYEVRIPFGPFLAIGAIIVVFFQNFYTV